MATNGIPKPPSKNRKCFAELDGLPGWLNGETYIHPTANCEISNSNCSQYVVFHNSGGLDCDISVELRCISQNVRYLKGESKLKHAEWSDTVRVLAEDDGYINAPLGVISEGDRQIIAVVEVTVTPLNGYERYLPPYLTSSMTSIRIACKSPI